MMQEDPNYPPGAADRGVPPAPPTSSRHRGSRRGSGGGGGGGDSSSGSASASAAAAAAASSASASAASRGGLTVPPSAPPPDGGHHPPIPPPSSSSSPTSLLSKLLLLVTILLRIILYPLRKLSTILFPPREFDGLATPGVSDRAARTFVSYFRKQYLLGGTAGRRAGAPPPPASASAAASGIGGGIDSDPSQCPFVPTGYKSTLTDIVNAPPSQTPLLMVYLHSPHHRDSSAFCRTTLSHPSVLSYLNNGETSALVRPFGASVGTADGTHLANLLGAAAYPYVALINVKSTGGGGGGNNSNGNGGGGGASNNARPPPATNPNITLELVLKLEGRPLTALPPPQFLAYLQTVIRQHSQTLSELELRRLQREQEAHLRLEQDREYQETLEADRAREAERQAEVERAEREERERAEEERRVEEERQDRLAVAMSLVGDEPPPSHQGNAPGSTARVRLTLPNGRKIDRRFHATDTIETVRAFLTLHFHDNSIGITNFSLSSSYPKRTFDDCTVTLEDAGLVPQAVLMVQDLDA